MKVKFGAIVTEGRGKLGGHVASRNAGGAYFRTRVTPVNPRTALQQSYRAVFGSISRAWRALTEAQRDAWNSAVSNWQKTDIFGDAKNPSGFNLHQKLNMIRNTLGESFLSLPTEPANVPPVLFSSADYLPGQITLNLISAAGQLDDATAIIIEATPPVSPGKKFVANLTRIIEVVAGDVVFSELGNEGTRDVTDVYRDKFGEFEDLTGQRIYFSVRSADVATASTAVGSGGFLTIT